LLRARPGSSLISRRVLLVGGWVRSAQKPEADEAPNRRVALRPIERAPVLRQRHPERDVALDVLHVLHGSLLSGSLLWMHSRTPASGESFPRSEQNLAAAAPGGEPEHCGAGRAPAREHARAAVAQPGDGTATV